MTGFSKKIIGGVQEESLRYTKRDDSETNQSINLIPAVHLHSAKDDRTSVLGLGYNGELDTEF